MLLPRGELRTIRHRNKKHNSAARPTASGVKTVQQRDVMDMRKILGQPHERIIRDTAMAVDFELTSKWEPCEGCSTAKARRRAAPQKYGQQQGDGEAGTTNSPV